MDAMVIRHAIARAEGEAEVYEKKLAECNDRIKKLKTQLKKECPHTYISIVDREYYEPVYMTSAATWKEKVCDQCGMVVAQQVAANRMEWGPGESLPR